ncbi:MAG: DnaJ domain-containing protein [Lachnospiraceae bacterium]|nr:DnaJ domain-containing protein [Lachnospiraceae bacterium]
MDPYKCLGVSKTASDEEVKRMYKLLSRRFHPDSNVNNPNFEVAENKFADIQIAYRQIVEERKNGYFSEEFLQKILNKKNDSADNVDEDFSHIKTAVGFINNGYFNEAMSALLLVKDRDADWYFIMAHTYFCLGEVEKASEFANFACGLDAYNDEYKAFFDKLSDIRDEDSKKEYGIPLTSSANLFSIRMIFVFILFTIIMCFRFLILR